METIKKNERFRFPAGGDGNVTVYKGVTVVEAVGNLLLVSYDDNPGQYGIYYYNGDPQNVLTKAHVFGETGGDRVRGIPDRPITTASLDVARAKFDELVELRKQREEAEAAAAQAAAEKKAAQEQKETERTRKILEAKKLRDSTRLELRQAIKLNRDIEDKNILNLITKLQHFEYYIKHV